MEEPVKETFPSVEKPLIYRPVVEVALAGPRGSTPKVYALVDSGAEHTYGSPWMPQALGITDRRGGEIDVGIVGAARKVRFADDVSLRLFPPGSTDEDVYFVWHAEGGFFLRWEPPWAVVLGQRGFFAHFTVTMHRPLTVVERAERFDARFSIQAP